MRTLSCTLLAAAFAIPEVETFKARAVSARETPTCVTGLKAGERVATENVNQLVDGTKVR